MKDFISHMFTGKDNKTPDLGRILWFQVSQVYMLISFYAIYKGSYVFDPLLWGSGLATLAGGFGAAIYAKAGTEPQPSEMVVKKGDVMIKQSFGKVSTSDDTDDAPTPPDAAPVAPDDTDTASVSATVSTTTSQK